jgi:microcin C transport system substrate-binding protein
VYDPHELYVFWVDETMRKETLEARRNGKSFPESNKIIDIYRTMPEPAKETPDQP